jgi:hypothetical protein
MKFNGLHNDQNRRWIIVLSLKERFASEIRDSWETSFSPPPCSVKSKEGLHEEGEPLIMTGSMPAVDEARRWCN